MIHGALLWLAPAAATVAWVPDRGDGTYTFISRPGVWTGAQIGLFAQAPNGTPASTATTVGHADFDWFRVGAAQ